MPFTEITFFAFSAICAMVICYRTLRTILSARWHHFKAEESRGCNDAMGFIGCSIITHNTYLITDIEQLLSSEYSRYEVILLLDSTHQEEHIARIIKHYRLTRVNHPLPEESALPISNLYRSTRREYRRLVLIDCDTTTPYAAMNAAISFASFDYIIPLKPHTALLPYAIETIATTLSDKQERNIELLYSDTIAPCFVFQRDGLLAHGGLSNDIARRVPKHSVLRTSRALTYHTRSNPASHIGLISLSLTTLAIACTISIHAIAIFGTTAALAAAAAHCSLLQWRVPNCSIKSLLYQIGKLLKFFRPIKFNIS